MFVIGIEILLSCDFDFMHFCGPKCVQFYAWTVVVNKHLTFSSKAKEFSVHFPAHIVLYIVNCNVEISLILYRNTVGTVDTTRFLKETDLLTKKLKHPGLCIYRYQPKEYALHPERDNGVQVLLLIPSEYSSSSFSSCQRGPTTNLHRYTWRKAGPETYTVNEYISTQCSLWQYSYLDD